MRHTTLTSLALLLAACNPTPEKPNIVVILADDLGYGDLGAYGSTLLKTPNIDRLANEGLRFTNGYCTSATCTPSRYGLLTGEYPWKNQRAQVLQGDAPLLIDPRSTTLPSLLRGQGYVTGIVGKWHLGLGEGQIDWNKHIAPGPNEIGFDEAYIMAATNDRVPSVYIENGYISGLDPADPIEINYRQNFEGEPTGRDHPELLTKMKASHGHDMSIHNGIGRIGYMRGGKAALWVDENMADTFLVRAQNFIRKHQDKTFFLYYALHQPHAPRIAHPRFVGSTPLGPRGDVISEADWCVGEIVKTINELGLRNKTLLIFSSDNGPVLDDGYVDQSEELNGDHTPWGNMRGGKYSLYEAGTHVPFISYWPGTIKPGISEALVCQLDLVGSFSAMLRIENPRTDSENMLKAFLGKSKTGRSSLLLQGLGQQVALRHENHILIPPYPGPPMISWGVKMESGRSSEYQLFDLTTDPGQKNNLAASEPELLEMMKKILEEQFSIQPGN